jgi:hypothetical protein
VSPASVESVSHLNRPVPVIDGGLATGSRAVIVHSAGSKVGVYRIKVVMRLCSGRGGRPEGSPEVTVGLFVQVISKV